MNNTIIIIDYGSQYTQLIARRIREMNVHSIIIPYDCKKEKFKKYNIKGLILSGGPSSVYEKSAPYLSENIFDLNVPILGICYGFQLLIENFKGSVSNSNKAEYGSANITIENKSLLFNGMSNESQVWMSHGDKVIKLPDQWSATSKSDNNIISSAENFKLHYYKSMFQD